MRCVGLALGIVTFGIFIIGCGTVTARTDAGLAGDAGIARDAGIASDGGIAGDGGLAGDGGIAGDAGATEWQSRASLPSSRQESAVAVLRGAIYSVGGLDANGRGLRDVVRFDVSTNEWQSVAPYPFAVDHAAAVGVDDRLLVLGGSENFQPGTPERRVFAYDPARDEWTRRADLPRARWAPSAATVGRTVFVGGGLGEGTTEILAYEAQNDRWSTLPALALTTRDHLGAAESGGLVYFVGGRTSANLRVVEALDPAVPSLTTRAQMPTARGGIAAASALGFLIVPGGEVFGAGAPPGGVYDTVDVYDVARNLWIEGPRMRTARHGHGVVTLGSVVFVVGGGFRAGLGATDTVESFDVAAWAR
jgi:N-acetylneuraminic acid mutarotase